MILKNLHMTGIMSRIKETAVARNWFLAAALLIGLIGAAPLFLDSGLLNTRSGGDSPFLLQRLHQLTTAVADGHFPARWMPDANYGYGYPFFNYYAPLSIYIAALFRLLGAAYVLAIKLAQLAGFLVAAWGMFLLGRRWLGSNWAGLLAASAYTLAPFHMVNVYVRGDSLAEFWAMALYPLVVLTLDRLIQGNRSSGQSDQNRRRAQRLGAALFALTYAALILSHNISALIFSPFLLLYLPLAYSAGPNQTTPDQTGDDTRDVAQSGKAHLVWVIVAIVLALAMAAWFWLPALGESSLAQLEPVTSGYFHYSNHFRGLNLVQRTFAFDYDPANEDVFGMGLVQATIIVLGVAGLLLFGGRGQNKTSRGRRLYIIAGLLLATFMITSLSVFLWDNLPLLPFAQFPWRFLSIQAFFGALASGGLALLPARRLIAPVALALLIVASLASLRPDFLPLSDADVTPTRLAQYEWYSGNIGTTVSAEYLPESVQPRPQTSHWLNQGQRDVVQVLAGELLTAAPLNLEADEQTWRVVAGERGVNVSLPTMAWPGWSGALDGQRAALEIADGSGLIAISVPPGEHLVQLDLGRTPIRMVGELVSAIALVAWAWLLATSKKWRMDGRALYLFGALLLFSITLRLMPEYGQQESDLNWDFAQMVYLNHANEGVEYENGATLNGYHYSSDEVTAGETLIVTLNWASGPGGNARLSLATPASNRNWRAPLFAQQDQEMRAGAIRYELAIPENAPAGLVVPRLMVEGAKPLTPSGLLRGDLYLRPLLLKDTPQPAEAGPDVLDVQALQVTARDDGLLDLQLQWLTRQPLSQNYNYSLRLVDSAGLELFQMDGQPGYGFLPSSGWSSGQWIDDWLALALPQGLPTATADNPYSLVMRLYDVASGDVVLTRFLGQLSWLEGELHLVTPQPVFALPQKTLPLAVEFGPADGGQSVDLVGYQMNLDDDQLELTLYWTAQEELQRDLFHFAHVVDSGGVVVAQHDGMPRHNTYPTSQWLKGEVVDDAMRIDLGQLPAGSYTLHVGLYRLEDGQALRIPIAAADGLQTAEQRLQLPEEINISP